MKRISTETSAGSARLAEVEQLYRAGQAKDLLQVSANPEHRAIEGIEGTRLAIVRAMAQFDVGDVTASLESLGNLALDESNPNATRFEACFALFLRTSDFATPDELLPPLTTLRQLAAQSGQARSLASLHLAVARLEGLRGLFTDAFRHLQLSRRLASFETDDAFQCTLDLVEGSLECMGGNLERSKLLSHRCLTRANQSDFAKYRLASTTNLSVIALHQGKSDQCRKGLDQVIPAASELTYVKFGALDTLAQAELHDGKLIECSIVFERCAEVLAADRLPARSWYDLAHQLTRCSYFERLRDWRKILDIAEDTDSELARRQYRAVRTSMLCAKARAMAHLGLHTEAQDVLATAIRTCPRSAVDPLIVLEGSKALCASLAGDGRAGAIHFDRALAGCRAVGHRFHERWISSLREEVGRTHQVALSSQRNLDTTEAALFLTDVATVIGAGHSIDLMAHRAALLLQNTSLRSRVDVHSEGNCEYQADPTATWESTPDGASCIALRGSDRRIDIRIGRVESLEEMSLIKSLADVVQAGVYRAADTEHEGDDQNLWPRAVVSSDEDAVFRSPRMIELIKIATRLASTDLPVLISGETGTGKEIFARLIHDNSKHRKGPFVPFNCATVPRDLVESQLFGHRRGAFTGALDSFPGLIRSAERGTLFLDEMGDLEVSVQPKLLRFLETGEIQPLGELRPHRIGVRLVAATNANIQGLIRDGKFRADLFYRIGGSVLSLPALRERKDEIPALAAFFLARWSKECGRTRIRLADDFVAALLLYDWPGNIRELSNEIRRAVALANDGDVLGARHLAPAIAQLWQARPNGPEAEPAVAGVHVPLDQTLAQAVIQLEEQFIDHALKVTGGRVAEAARLLGLSRKGLFLKRRRRGLAAEDIDAAEG
jgi:DNA-binding NtrC family response regulator